MIGTGPARSRRWSTTVVVVLCTAALAGAALGGVRSLLRPTPKPSMLRARRVEARERELETLLPHLRSVPRVGFLAWKRHAFLTQYIIAPTIVVWNDTDLDYLLVELDAGQKASYSSEVWYKVAESPHARFQLLKKRAGR